MKSSVHIGSLGNAVVALVIVAVAGLTLNVRMTRVLSLDGSQQVKAKPSHDANWALEIAGNAAAAFRLEMEHGNDDDNDDLEDTLLSAPSQSPQVEVAGISELMDFSFWAKNGFCKVIQNLTIVPEANMSSSSSQLRLSTRQQQPPTLPVVVNFTFGCKDLFKKSELGTGNWLSSF
jgi:hypothetical protein